MCGIAGGYGELNTKSVKKMLNAISHRGPDDAVTFKSNSYYGGMARLSINDIQHGNQPLTGRDKNIKLIYNGEIYNYSKLRVELEDMGYVFNNHSDGQVIPFLYELYGVNMLNKLDGMYAIALYDEDEHLLLLARDFLGEKPLYVTEQKEFILFCSEVSGIECVDGVKLTLNKQSIYDMPSFLWCPEPFTMYKEVYALSKGSYVIYDEKLNKLCGEIKPEFGEELNFSTFGEKVQHVQQIVRESIRDRLMSDVPVGAFLSGGLDSSIVVAIAKEYYPKLKTYSVGFNETEDIYHGYADESLLAEAYAEKLNLEHKIIRLDSEICDDMLNDFVKYSDQPFAVSSGLGVMAISKEAAHDGIKVLLSGDCADEMFGGYSWYKYLEDTNATNCDSEIGRMININNLYINESKRRQVMKGLAGPSAALALHYYADDSLKKLLFSENVNKIVVGTEKYFSDYKNEGAWSREDYIENDRDFYMTQEMLRKLDRMTMAYSVEGRVPFAAIKIFNFVKKLKYEEMVAPDGTLKIMLRSAFEKQIPRDIIKRPKHGFNFPIDKWLRNEWYGKIKQNLGKNSALYQFGIIKKDAVQTAQELIKQKDFAYGHFVFSLIVMNMWLEKRRAICF